MAHGFSRFYIVSITKQTVDNRISAGFSHWSMCFCGVLQYLVLGLVEVEGVYH